jgi:hypothetical protein
LSAAPILVWFAIACPSDAGALYPVAAQSAR